MYSLNAEQLRPVFDWVKNGRSHCARPLSTGDQTDRKARGIAATEPLASVRLCNQHVPPVLAPTAPTDQHWIEGNEGPDGIVNDSNDMELSSLATLKPAARADSKSVV